MRILTILLIALAFSISSFAQQGVQERAKKITDEMTMVLSLDEQTSEKVYNIQLKRFIDAQALETTHKDDKEKMKEELKKLQNRFMVNLNQFWR